MHRVVVAALLRDGRVLLGHRSPHRTWYPDVWDLPGGHIDVDESAERAVVRELLEEVGVTVEEAAVEPVLGLDVPADPDIHLSIYRAPLARPAVQGVPGRTRQDRLVRTR